MIGESRASLDVREKVTGEARFAGDWSLPGMLHMKLRFADHPHAKILSIDTSRAVNAPGVVAVLTAEDVPDNRYGLIIPDQPVLCDDRVRFVGDQICAVIAKSPQQAEQAASLIDVSYQPLPVLASIDEALDSQAPFLHADCLDNIAHRIRLRRGDPEKAIKDAAVVLEDEYITSSQEHTFLEPEAGMAYLDERGILTIRTAGQCLEDDQRQIASALCLSEEMVRVVYGPIGGAFGGREDISVQIILALAAWRLKRPVRMVWSREESIWGHGKRHRMKIRHRWAADPTGKVTAAEIDIFTDAGAYLCTSSSVLECLLGACVGPYEIPNIRMDGIAVFTNNPPGTAFRGYGTPQTAFAAEMQMSQLAELLHIDPVTIRLRNILKRGSLLPTQNEPINSSNLGELITICAREAGWTADQTGWQPPHSVSPSTKHIGHGIALGMKATGYGYGFPESSEAEVILHGKSTIEEAKLITGAVDVGQGSRTVLAQIAAHTLGISETEVSLAPLDTAHCGHAGAAAASRLTFMAGNAVKLAAERALQEWKEEKRPAAGAAEWYSPPTTQPHPQTGKCVDNFSYAFSAQAATVQVDRSTGQVSVLDVTAVQDVGRAINPQKIEGQIEGAVVQALGWCLLEKFILLKGQIATDSLATYLIPTAADVPERIKIFLLENPDPNGPYGVRGVGEVPFVPLAPAVGSAVNSAVGVRIRELPITPEKLWKLLHRQGENE